MNPLCFAAKAETYAIIRQNEIEMKMHDIAATLIYDKVISLRRITMD
jgi:hypothetical protein